MRSKRLSLGLKFSLAVTVLIVLTMLAVTTLIINYQKESLRQAAFESNLAMTRNLAHDAEGHLLMFDPLRLNELVATVQEAASCAYAMIVDRDGISHPQPGQHSHGLLQNWEIRFAPAQHADQRMRTSGRPAR